MREDPELDNFMDLPIAAGRSKCRIKIWTQALLVDCFGDKINDRVCGCHNASVTPKSLHVTVPYCRAPTAVCRT